MFQLLVWTVLRVMVPTPSLPPPPVSIALRTAHASSLWVLADSLVFSFLHPGIGSEITKCCPACFHRITRRLSNENGPEPDMSSAQVAENFAGSTYRSFLSDSKENRLRKWISIFVYNMF